MTKLIYTLIIILLSTTILAQRTIKSYVHDENDEPLVGANIKWQESGRGTTTNVDGYFEIEQRKNEKQLVVSYVGYETTIITVDKNRNLPKIQLKESIELTEVVVSERRAGLISQRSSVLQTQKITYDELCRAACCNLAESFETNPSVDVSYADASTGARQIKLLGLAGTYVQMLTENYPNFRGASMLYGGV